MSQGKAHEGSLSSCVQKPKEGGHSEREGPQGDHGVKIHLQDEAERRPSAGRFSV